MKKVKIVPNYKNSVAVIPSRVIDFLSDATEDDVAVLIAALRDGAGFDPARTCDELGVNDATLLKALSFWEERGIITVREREGRGRGERSVPFGKKKKGAEVSPSAEKTKRSPVIDHRTPPLTAEELADRLESKPDFSGYLKDLSSLIGKPLTVAETNKAIGMIEYLSVETEYVLLVAAHVAKRGKISMHSIEKKTYEIYDNGATSYSALVEELAALEKAQDFEGVVRRVFGVGGRVLTKKEQDFIRTWAVDWNVGEELLREAYEVTANNTGEVSFPYTNAVLDNWHAHGVTTAEEAKKFQTDNSGSRRGKKGAKGSDAVSSFDTDDFFEAALKRSYQDK